MVTTSISATVNNAERSDDVDILLTPADAARYARPAAYTFTRFTNASFLASTPWGQKWNGSFSREIIEIRGKYADERCFTWIARASCRVSC